MGAPSEGRTAGASGGLLGWIEDRVDLSAARELIKKKSVPIHRHSIWYYLGGTTLFLFVVQVVTGILLLLYYRPTADAAYESVKFIVSEVRFGWLVRSIHHWSANLMILGAFIHMFSVMFLKAYRHPRELTWWSGMLLLLLSMAFGFSGYLLPWNELAFFATKVGTEILHIVPGIGEHLVVFLRGGEQVTGATLTRFFGFHVAVLPMIATAFLLLHVWLVQKQGMSVPVSVERDSSRPRRSIPFIPHFLLRDLLGWLILLGVLAALSAFKPAHLGLEADPFQPAPAGIKPEWYFLFAFQFLKLIPSKVLFLEGEGVAVFLLSAAGAVWFLVPVLDRRSRRGEPSPLFTAFGLIAIAVVVALTVWALLEDVS
jgi:cytochrome b6